MRACTLSHTNASDRLVIHLVFAALAAFGALAAVCPTVVLDDSADSSLEHGEERDESLRATELHDVLALLLDPVECVEDEAGGDGVERGRQRRGRGAGLQSEQRLEQLDAAHLRVLPPLVHAGRNVDELQRFRLEKPQHVQHDHGRGHDLAREEAHAAARDRGQRRVVQVLNLEDDADVRSQREPLAVGKRQKLVVIENALNEIETNISEQNGRGERSFNNRPSARAMSC